MESTARKQDRENTIPPRFHRNCLGNFRPGFRRTQLVDVARHRLDEIERLYSSNGKPLFVKICSASLEL